MKKQLSLYRSEKKNSNKKKAVQDQNIFKKRSEVTLLRSESPRSGVTLYRANLCSAELRSYRANLCSAELRSYRANLCSAEFLTAKGLTSRNFMKKQFSTSAFGGSNHPIHPE